MTVLMRAPQLLLVFACIVWALSLVWLIAICCLWSRIALAIALNEVASDFLRHTPHVIFVPMIQALIGIAYVIFWAFCASFILSKVPKDYTPTKAFSSYSIAYGTHDDPGECTNKWPTGYVWRYEGDNTSTTDPCSGNLGDTTGITPHCWRCTPPRYIFGFPFAWAFFSLLWNNAFLIAAGQLVIAGACSVWFFAVHGTKNKVRSVSTGVKYCFRFHMGTLAFGSFIIAVVQFIRYLITYYQKQMEQMKNRIAAFILKITAYLIWCLEKCLKFLTKNAYIQVAIKGTNFCTSAKNAFFLITRNAVRFGLLSILGGVIHFIGVGAIIIMTCFIGYFILTAMHPEVSVVVPMFIFFCISYVVAKLFMTVFHMAVDSMLQCFIEVEEDKDVPHGGRDFVPGPLRTMIQGKE